MESSLSPSREAAPAPPDGPSAGAAGPAPAEGATRRLEARLRRLEAHLGFAPLSDEAVAAILEDRTVASPLDLPQAVAAEELEKQIGEYWLARAGVVALSLGLSFLVAFPLRGVPPLVSSLIGFAAAVGLGLLAQRWRAVRAELAGFLLSGACFLMFFAVLRLHFRAGAPSVVAGPLVLGLLTAVVAGEFWIALRWGSQLIAAFVLVLALAGAAIAGVASYQFLVLVGLSVFAAAVAWRRGWAGFALAATALILLAHVDWLLGHPLLGRAPRGVGAPAGNLFALAVCAVSLASVGCRPGAQDDHVGLRVGRAFLLGAGVLLVVLINGALFPRITTGWVTLGAGAAILAGAVACWAWQRSVYATAVFTCAGNLLVSVAILRLVPPPGCYAWLAWQSLLVAVLAVAWRSRIILVANLVIYAGIYAAYVALSDGAGAVNLSFALAALLTAELLQWRREALALRTGLMRNLYLGAAGVAIPYGLYQLVPRAWVGASWLGAAAGYFVASALLRSPRFRWMGIFTTLATIAWVFVVDLAHLDPAYRIVSFLVLGVGLLVISLVYSRRARRGARPAAGPAQD